MHEIGQSEPTAFICLIINGLQQFCAPFSGKMFGESATHQGFEFEVGLSLGPSPLSLGKACADRGFGCRGRAQNEPTMFCEINYLVNLCPHRGFAIATTAPGVGRGSRSSSADPALSAAVLPEKQEASRRPWKRGLLYLARDVFFQWTVSRNRMIGDVDRGDARLDRNTAQGGATLKAKGECNAGKAASSRRTPRCCLENEAGM
jgi:hypothetical protein